MVNALPLLTFLLSLPIGGVLVFVFLRHRISDTEAQLTSTQQELAASREQRAVLEERAKVAEQLRVDIAMRDERILSLTEDFMLLREAKARMDTQIQEERKAFEEQKSLLDDAQQKLADAFNALSSDALRKNNQAFLELARETLEGYNKEAKGELDKRKQAIDSLVNPLKESLEKVDKHVKELEEKRSSAYATLSEQVKSLTDSQTKLQSETSNLVKALRNPNQRGRWGEMQLKRVVEMAGMLEWCDFHEQQTTTSDGNTLRPDITVKMPNNKTIVVDSKTPLDAYLKAIESTDDGVRAEAMKAHAKQVREHIRQLSNKRYWDQFESTPEIVVMFIPGEPLLGAALEQDPALIEYGVENKVLIATPVTLIGLLRSVAYGWRQESLEQNAQKISQLGRDLYSRIAGLAEHFSKVGKNLDRAVGSYNDAVGSFEMRVLPQARKFKELQAATADDIELLEPLERNTRLMHRPELRPRGNTIVASDLFTSDAVVNS
jgi:DNA recombination protein RmuC